MFQNLELGVSPVKTYEVNEKFFEEFGWTREAGQAMERKPAARKKTQDRV